MKNSFNVVLFLLCGALTCADCSALGPVKSTDKLTNDVRSLKKSIADLREHLNKQDATLRNDLLGQLAQQSETFEGNVNLALGQLQKRVEALENASLLGRQESPDIVLFDTYARIDAAVNSFSLGGKEIIRQSLEQIKQLKLDSVDMLQHNLYAVGILYAFDKFSFEKSMFLSANHECVMRKFLSQKTDIIAYKGSIESTISVSFADLLFSVYMYSNKDVPINWNNGKPTFNDKASEDLEKDTAETRYRMQSLELEDLRKIIDNFTISESEIDQLIKDDFSSIADGEDTSED